MADNECDICGDVKKNAHGVAMHKRLVHDVPGRTTKSKQETNIVRVMLTEAWHDDNGRILLTDQNGEWWVAKKLDV